MVSPIVFFSRCKPQGADAIKIVLDNKRVFIGYPMGRKGARYDPRNLRACVVDPSCPDEEWSAAHAESDGLRQYNQNRNLIGEVGKGSIVLVPRQNLGVIYCGRVTSKFRLENAPAWYDRYMEFRETQGLGEDSDDAWHAADVAQCWKVDEFRPIPVPRIPAWIRRSLFGRSTYGIIRENPVTGVDPHNTLSQIMDGSGFEPRSWTLNRAEVESRLVDDLTPSNLEHLVVSLLQLENPDEAWLQVGGPGDGGIDGIGVARDGSVAGVLQCKWQYWGGDCFPDEPVWGSGGKPARKYLAALLHPENVEPPSDAEFLDRRRIVELVVRHHARLPQAFGMRIGSRRN